MTQSIVYVVILGMLMPWIMLLAARNKIQGNMIPTLEHISLSIEPDQDGLSADPTIDTQPLAVVKDIYIPILTENGTIVNMELDSYIIGVVLAEMPSDFELEALKAQAVVARTYALKHHFEDQKHNSGAICTDSTCCQAFISPDEYLESGGNKKGLNKIEQSVYETGKMVLTFEGKLIDATYFSCSGGRTEDAKDVWGANVPYLQAVDSPGEEASVRYMDTVYFTKKEFADCMQLDVAQLSGRWIGEITYTGGGGVDQIDICGQQYAGTKMRSILGLRSTAFVISAVGDSITITTKGFGHRVGMSQYGADAMAVSGSDYIEILTHYYQGTKIEEFVV